MDPAFTEPGATSYQAEVDYAVTEVTVTFTLKDPDATFETLGDAMDVDPNTHSIRVPLMKSGRNFVNWKVRAKDGYSIRDYHVTIFRAYPPTTAATPTTGGGGGGGGGGASGPSPSTVDFEWNVKRDLAALAPGQGWATGLWSDGETLWIAENGRARTTPSSPTASRAGNASRSASSRSTSATAPRAASGRTARPCGSPTAAATGSSPTT